MAQPITDRLWTPLPIVTVDAEHHALILLADLGNVFAQSRGLGAGKTVRAVVGRYVLKSGFGIFKGENARQALPLPVVLNRAYPR
jgi:hypothetical protein